MTTEPTSTTDITARAEADTAPGDTDDDLRSMSARSALRFTRTRFDSGDAEDMLQAIVANAMEVIAGAAGASITLIDREGVFSTHAPSSEQVAEIDAVQAALGEGPCIDALRDPEGGVSDVPDLTDWADPPWPRFAARAREAGFGSVLSHHLVASRLAGSLNLWASVPAGFTDDDRLRAALLADQAAVALAGARRGGQLNQALASRDLIGRAKGILMERFRVHDDRAFQMLVSSSQDTNVKLVDVATWVVNDAETRYDAPQQPAASGGDDGPESLPAP